MCRLIRPVVVGRNIVKSTTGLLSTGTTVDTKEVEKFEKLAPEWWHPSGPMKPLHSMNKLRVPFVRDGLINEGSTDKQLVGTSKPLKGLLLLDVGCGGGILSEALSRLGALVTGIDATEKVLNMAKKHAEDNNLAIEYFCTSVEHFSQKNIDKFDAIVASEVVEHLTEKCSFIAACSKCIKPTGSIFITTMNNTFLAHFLGVCMAENILSLLPQGTHQADKFVEPHKLQRILEDNDLRLRLVHGMVYNFASNNWSWSSNTAINYAMHAVKSALPLTMMIFLLSWPSLSALTFLPTKMQKSLKWSPAQPQRKNDNIISSKARETGDLVGFVPSYLKESVENMKFIMSNEYLRKWFNERGSYEKDTYSKEQIIKEESRIKRRFVQRMMTYKTPVKSQLFQEHLQKPIQIGEQPPDYRKFKYKPVCPKAHHLPVVKSRNVGKGNSSPTVDKTKNNSKSEENETIIMCPAICCSNTN